MARDPANPGAAPRPESGQAQVRNLFPTPVAILAVPDADRINDALEARILARESEVASVSHSNWGGWQSPTDFPEWCGPEGETVLGMAQNLARGLTADRQGGAPDLRWRLNAWANVNRLGQGNEFHTHPGAYWSATYYVRDGGASDNPELGGEFEIQDPRGVAPAMLAPMLAFRTAGGQSVGANETIVPRAGNLVMFPSWLSHGVRPYHGQDVRISIAVNLTPA
ncbi:MAG: TIGR02466 family protein [Alphaproteobacteria bacterium]